MKDSIKRYFFCLRFNILPCLFIVFRGIPSCIMLMDYDLSEIGGVTILVVGGFDKVRGLIQSRGLEPCCILWERMK